MTGRLPYQNQVIITGRLVRDPEFRTTQKGTSVCFFDIASNRRFKNQSSGEWSEETTFVPVIAWGDIANRCKDKIKKGSPVYIEGRLSNSEYTNKDGVKVKKVRVVVNKIQILEVVKELSDKQTDAGEDVVEEVKESSDISKEGDDEIPF